MTQRRPKGTSFPIDKAWKARLEQAISEHGGQVKLARAVGCTSSAIDWLLKPSTKNTRLKPMIHRALGWSMEGMVESGPPWLAEWQDLLEAMTEDEREQLASFLRARPPR